MKGLILAGGTGTRLRPITHTANKHLIPIANKPTLLYGIEAMREAGINEIGIILGTNDPEAVKNYIEDGSKFGVKVTYIFQGEPKGIAHAVYCAKDFIGNDSFVTYLGDNILRDGIKYLINDFKKSDSDSHISLCSVKNPQRFGVAELDENGKIKKLVEKPKKPKSDLALVGVYIFKPVIFEIIEKLKPSDRGELEITEAIDQLIKRKFDVRSSIINGWWKDTGKPEDILEVNKLILDNIKSSRKGEIEEGAKIHGRVKIGEKTLIHKGALIKGPVIIGKNCIIGPGTYIGPYTSIGDNTEIYDCEIEDSVIIGDTKIKSKKRIVDSLIGKNSEIYESSGMMPKGHRFLIGENSRICI